MESPIISMVRTRCEARYLGRVDYGEALELQHRLLERRKAGEIRDQLMLLEHPHVITLGRRASIEDILVPGEKLRERGIALYHVGRGGQATYHGPGQLVGYPIIGLHRWGGPRDYVHALEEVLIRTMAAYGVAGQRAPGHPGVWVNGAKLAAIGVRISGGVTSHGFALNVHPDLELFSTIVPCGTPGLQVTSLERLMGAVLPLEEVARRVAQEFAALFGWELCWGAEIIEGITSIGASRG